MKCPDCEHQLRGDGSCCDDCGWTMVGGGDDPRLPSKRSRDEIRQATDLRTKCRAVALLDHAGALMREAVGKISTLPDTKGNQALHGDAIGIEQRIRGLESKLRATRV